MREKNLSRLMVGLVVGICLIISACTPVAPAPEVPEEKPLRLTIAGGSMGSNSNLAANTLAGIAKSHLGIDTTVIWVATAGIPESLHLGLIDASTSNTPTLMYEYTGEGMNGSHEPYDDLRILLYRAPSKFLMFVPADSPVKSFKDMIGLRVSPGEKGFISDFILQWVCDALGVPYDDFTHIYLGHKDASAALVAGKVDVVMCVSPGLHPTHSQTDLMFPLRAVEFSKEEVDAINKMYPHLMGGELPKIYRGMDAPIRVVEQADVLATTNRLPEEIGYGLVKGWMSDPEFVGYFHADLRDYVESGWVRKFMETATDPVPFHAGVIRYLEEVGWNYSPNKIPPEYKK